MKKMTSKELRKNWIKFYEDRGHINIGTTSLIGDGTTGVLFNVAGIVLMGSGVLLMITHFRKRNNSR